MSFIALVGGGAIVCYITGTIFDNAGLSALGVGLTIYALHGGGL